MTPILVCVTAALVIAFLYVRLKAPSHKARLRIVAPYLAGTLVAALVVVGWLAIGRWAAQLFGRNDPGRVELITVYINGVMYAILATAAVVVLLRLRRKLADAVDRRVGRWARARERIRLRGLDLMSRKRVHDSVVVALKISTYIAVFLVLYIYVSLVLSFFPVTAPYAGQLFQYVWQPATEIGLAVLGYLPNVAYLALIVVVARYALKLLRFLLNAVGKGDLVVGTFDPEWADPTYKLLRVLAIVFALMIGFPYLPGADSKFFQGFSLFVGALVTLGSSAAVGNMVAGVILTYTRAFRIGDRVRIGEAVGDVQIKSLFVTQLRTIYNEDITLPNGVVLGGQVVNYSSAAKRGALVLRTEVGLGYDVHWSKIEELLKLAANQTQGILPDPPPFVWPKALGDFAVVYELHAYTDRADAMGATCAALRRAVLDVLHDAGVEIMTPDVHGIRDSSRTAVPGQHATARPARSPGIRIDMAEQS